MAIGRSRSSNRTHKLHKRRQTRRQENQRKMLLESLEARQLLAVGPQLIGVQPNRGELLPFDRTAIRVVAPQELTFRFDENQVFSQDVLDAIQATEAGIQITRANQSTGAADDGFEPAFVQSNLNTGGRVDLRFDAVKLGPSKMESSWSSANGTRATRGFRRLPWSTASSTSA